MIEFAIVGLGAWGLSVLERTVSRARSTRAPIRVHVVQPGASGGGVYSQRQPDFLLLNNACGQLALYAAPDDGPAPRYAASLHEWALARGYRWVGHECVIGGSGRAVEATDYLPRRLMGEYLDWFYSELVSSAPPNLEIVRHDASVVDVVAEAGGRERLVLGDGTALRVGHVVMTSGHTQNEEPGPGPGGIPMLRPYPVEFFDELVAPGSPVAISGVGLVGYDLVTALTIGRGGRHVERGSRLEYVRSGREPSIYLYSRSGVPYCAKAAHGVDPTGDYEPVVCTPEFFSSLGPARGESGRRRVDFRSEVLPELLAEMQCRFLRYSAYLSGGADRERSVAEQLRVAWAERRFASEVDALSRELGEFDPAAHVFAGSGSRFDSSADYEAAFYSMLEADLDEALAPRGSAIKAAQEVTRILRDQLRSVIEFGGLTLDSYVDFQSNVRRRVNRLEAGPPPLRSQQLLALMDAGVVRVPLGPAPDGATAPNGRTVLRSTQLERLHAVQVSSVIRGHLDMPSLARSASPLLRRLYATGRLTQFCYGDTPVGSVAIDEEFHPYDVEGRLQRGIFVLGVLTEGIRYFTHYLPSPKSRLRAVLDAQRCVEAVLEG
ncbi:MAG: FAD/NAD(P)-binding protein [Actinomycetota bacterium]|nr:FAD/NAD(P)-binding protein [Actinomycetota bacterium]